MHTNSSKLSRNTIPSLLLLLCLLPNRQAQGANGTAYYFDYNGSTAGFGSPSGVIANGESGSYWTTSTAGTTTPAALDDSRQLTFGYSGTAGIDGSTFTLTLDNSTRKWRGLLINSPSANITFVTSGSGNSYIDAACTFTVAAGSTFNENILWNGNGLNCNSQTITLAGGGIMNFGAPIGNNNGSITVNDAGAGLTVNLLTNRLAASSTGTFTLTKGRLNFAHPSATNAWFFNSVNLGGGTLDNTTGSPMTLQEMKAFTFSGSFTFAGSSSLDLGKTNVTLTASPTLTVNNNTLSIGGAISGNYTLTKAGAGTLALSGANTHSGTTLSAGTLQLTGAGKLGSSTATLTVNGGTLDLGGTAQTVGTANLAAGTVQNGSLGGAAANLTKTTAGILNLNVTNTCGGNATISGGVLVLGPNSSLGNSPAILLNGGVLDASALSAGLVLNPTNGQTLTGTNAINGNVTVDYGTVLAVGVGATPGVLTLSNNLTCNDGSTLSFYVGNTATAASNDLLVVNGNLTSAGQTTVNFNFINGAPDTSGTPYTILVCNGTIDPNFVKNLSPGSAYAATFAQVGNTIQVSFGARLDPNLVWQGDGVGGLNRWLVGVTNQWTNSTGQATTFFNGANATFDDTTANNTVNVFGTVKPAAWTVNAASTYLFQGAGKVSGGTALTKSGAGTMIVGTANDYTNGTVIAGGALVLTNGGVLPGAVTDNAQLIVDRSDAFTLANVVAGSGSVTKQNTNTLILTATNTYAGGTVINNGTLQLGDGSARNGNVGSDILNNAILAVANPSALTLSNAVSGTGKLVKQAAGTLTLFATNTYTGGTLVSAGTLQVGDGGADGSLGIGVITNNSTLVFNSANSQTVADNIYGTGSIYHNGAGMVTLNNTTLIGNLYVGGSTNTTSVLNIPANFTITNNGWITVGASSLNATGIVNQSSGTVIAGGSGGVQLGWTVNQNTYGQYNLSGGSLYATGTTYGLLLGVNSKNGGQFNMTGGALYVNNLEVSRSSSTGTNTYGCYTQTGGTAAVTTLTLGGANSTNNAGNSAQFSVSGGSFIATNFTYLAGGNNSTVSLNLGPGAQVTLPAFPTTHGSGATINLTMDGATLTPYAASANYLSGLSGAALTANGATFNVPAGKDITVPQQLTGTGGTLTKTGAGALTLTSYNQYDGLTTVSQGSLWVNTANGTISGPVTVTSGAVFGGNGGAANGGTVLSLNVAQNGTVSPGPAAASAGTLMVAGDCAFGNGSLLALDLDNTTAAANNDQLQVVGALSSSGPMYLVANLLNGAPALNQPYTIITYGSLDGNFLGNLRILSQYPATVADAGGSITLTFTSTNQSAPSQLTWQGDGTGNLWQAGLGLNWTNALGQSTVFFQNDAVAFNDSADNLTANVVGSVQPSSLTVSSSKNYTFLGSGKISGPAGLSKSGPGTLTLGTANDFTGNTLVAGGTLALTNGGSVAGFITNNAQVVFNRSDSATVTNLISGSGSLANLGGGTVSLTASNTYAGDTTLSAGTLQVNNGATLGSGTVTMNGGNLQAGTGAATLANAIQVNNVVGGSGLVAPSGQNLYLNGNLLGNGVLNKLGAYSLFLGGDNSGFSGSVTNIQSNVFFSRPEAASASTWWAANVGILGVQGFTNGPATFQLGALSGAGTLHTEFCGSTNTFEIGGLNLNSTFNGIIEEYQTTNRVAISKVGSGTLTLVKGSYSYTAGTTVKAGTLALAGGNNVLATSGSVLINGPTAVLDLATNSHQFGPVTLVQGMITNGISFSANPLNLTNGTVWSSISGGTVVNNYGDATLAGINSHTGNTLVNSGTLHLGANATLGKSTAIVASGAVLDVAPVAGGFILATNQGLGGFGTVHGMVTAAAGSTLTPGSFAVPGLLTLDSSLAMQTGASLMFDLANTTTPANNDSLRVQGNLSSSGPVMVNFSFLNGVPATGVPYTIISCSGTLDPAFAGNLSAPAVTRYTPVFAQAGNSITVTFTAGAAGTDQLVWQGDGVTNLWTADSAAYDWTNLLGVTSTFLNADRVTFDDSAANLATTVAGDVAPGSILVNNNANAYRITGSGRIVGGTGLTKTGTNSLLLGTANTFLGPVNLQAGTLVAGNGAALGATNGGTVISAGATLDVNAQNLDGESITVSGAGIGGAGAIVNNAGSQQQQALEFVTLAGDTVFGGSQRWDLRWPDANNTPGASLTGNFNLTKVGPNFIALVGVTVDPRLGNVDVQQGTLSFEHTTTSLGDPNARLTVETNATFNLWSITNQLNKQITLNGGTLLNGAGASTVVGPITFSAGDLTNRIDTSGGNLTLLGALGGSGAVTKLSGNTLFLGADNNWSGGLTIAAGNVVVGTNGAAGSLGSGNLTNNSALFFNRSDLAGVFSGGIFSTGKVYQIGSGAFTLSGANFYSGDTLVTNGTLRAGAPNVFSPASTMNLSAPGTLDLAGNAQGLSSLIGNGMVTSASAATLTVSNGSFNGAIGGAVTLVKGGSGLLILQGTNTYTGPTIVQQGTLRVGTALAPVPGCSRWYDAANPANLAMDGNGRVSSWTDLSGNSNAVQANSAIQPQYIPNVLNGLGALYFMGPGNNKTPSTNLLFGTDSNIRSVFSVFKGSSFLLTDSGSTYSFHRSNPSDAVCDFDPTDPLWDATYSSGNIRGGSTYVNGALVNGTTFVMPTNLNNGFNLIEVLTTGIVTANGFNRDRTSNHSGNQYQAEVLLYDFALTEAQRLQNEVYLNAKWFGVLPAKPVGVLPASSSVQVAAGAVLDLAYSSAAISGLTDYSGAGGLVTNSSGLDSDLSVGGPGSSSFSGSVGGNLALTKNGTGTLTLSGISTYSGATLVNNGTLLVNGSLGTNAVTVAGGTLGGNGTLGGAVTVNPGGTLSPGAALGTLTVGSDLALAGSLLAEVDNSQSPASDLVAVSGIASLGGSLRVRATGGAVLPTDQFVILTAGAIVGSFTNLDASGRVAVENMPGATFHVTVTPTSVVLDNYTVVSVPSSPRVSTVKVSGGNLLLSGSGGPTGTGHNYYVLGSTNVALRLTNWTVLATNVFTPDGTFSTSLPVTPAEARKFYRLQVP